MFKVTLSRLRVAVVATWIAIPPAAPAQTGDGFIGIYANPSGTTPCGEVAPQTAAVLYLVAKVGGLTASGITGAEFRVEVSNPAGWQFYASLYNSPTMVGASVMDTDPSNSNDGTGVALAYSPCLVPDANSTILVGQIVAYNTSGGPTDLLVKSRSTPSNPQYPCPLLVACDAPTFSKACMTPTTDPPCSLLVPLKPVLSSASDPSVFTFALNRIPEPIDTSRPFAMTIPLGNSELWVVGRRLEQSDVVCEFDGTSFRIGGVEYPLVSKSEPTDAELRLLYQGVPFVQSKLLEGRTLAEAAALFGAETGVLIMRARVAYRRGSVHEVRTLFQSSPLVESFEINERAGMYAVRYRGLGARHIGKLAVASPLTPSNTRRESLLEEQARAILEAVESQLKFGGKLIMVHRSGVSSFRGRDRQRAQAQIDHVVARRSLDDLPEGPLLKGPHSPLTDILDALGAPR